MRWLKFVVALLAIWSLGLTVFTTKLRRVQLQNQESVESLLYLLEVHKWELPIPKDASLEWSFEFRDYKESNAVGNGLADWMDSSRKAKIVFMPTGEETIHRFWLVQANGTSSGRTRIDVCADPERIQRSCDTGQIEYVWYPEAKRIDDGKTYVICEVNEAFPPHRRKQLVLRLIHYRLEDILKDSPTPLTGPPSEPKPAAPKSPVSKTPAAKS